MSSLYDSITGVGAIEVLESRFQELTKTRFAVAVCNATSALHAALIAAGIKRGDEVIVPAYTWGGSITGILQIGAIPVFADIDDTLTLDPEDVIAKITERTKAVIVVHLFGHPASCFRLQTVCHDAHITLIEDCAQAFGAKERGQSVGSFGTGCFSFSWGKILNAGEGGMLTTNDELLYDRVLYYTQHPLRQRKDMREISRLNQFALNYRLSPQAAKAALTKFDNALKKVSENAKAFSELSVYLTNANLSGFIPVTVRDNVYPSWHHYSPALCTGISTNEIETIQRLLNKLGYQLEKGYVSEPLYRDSALYEYLSHHVKASIKRLVLPKTEFACKSRVGIKRATKTGRIKQL